MRIVAQTTKASRRLQKPHVKTVTALERGLAVLGCFRAGVGELSNGDIAQQTGIPKSTVTRLVATLVSHGYLRQARETGRFALGAGVVAPAQAFFAGLDIRSIARPHMVELAELTGTSVYLAVRDGLDMFLIETVRSTSTVLFSRLDVGARVPIAVTAVGRAYVSALDEPRRTLLLDELRRAAGSDWPQLAAGLKEATAESLSSGYCLSIGDWHPHIHSIAVALEAGGELMALSCAVPALIPAERLRTAVAPRLIETAHAIARDAGGTVAPPAPDAEPTQRTARRARS